MTPAFPLARIRFAAEQLPVGSLVTVPDAGHWVQRDRADLVIPAMRDHLERSGDAQAPRP